MEFNITIADTVKNQEINKGDLENIARKIFLEKGWQNIALNIVLVDDAFITDLNKQYLNKKTTTDVISFVLERDDKVMSLEGEVYANLAQIKRQAIEYEVSFKNELFRIVIHGILHLIGYDDQQISEKEEMTKQENYFLSLI